MAFISQLEKPLKTLDELTDLDQCTVLYKWIERLDCAMGTFLKKLGVTDKVCNRERQGFFLLPQEFKKSKILKSEDLESYLALLPAV